MILLTILQIVVYSMMALIFLRWIQSEIWKRRHYFTQQPADRRTHWNVESEIRRKAVERYWSFWEHLVNNRQKS